LAVAPLLLLALCPGVARAGSWLRPVPLNLSTGTFPSLALDATGNVIAAWQTNPASPAVDVIQGARHVVGRNGFAQLPDISTDTTAMDSNMSPLVVMNASGNGLVIWINFQSGGHEDIQLRTILPNGDVGPVKSVPSGPAPMATFGNIAAAINDNGDAVVAWTSGSATEAITRQGLGGAFTDVANPTQLVNTSSAFPSVAIDGAGNAIVAYPVFGGMIDAKRHPASGSWATMSDTPLTVPSHTLADPVVAANAAGQMVVAFSDNDGANIVIDATTGTVAAGWGSTPAITTLSGGEVTHGPGVSVDDNGGAAVGWSTSNGSTSNAVQVSLRPPHGSFPAPAAVQSITPVPGLPDSFTLAGNGRGDVVASWYTFDMGALHNVVRAAVKPAGSNTFQSSQIASDPSTDSIEPAIALDHNGDVVVGFSLGPLFAGTGVAIYDGAGPLLATPSGPATVGKGVPAAFSVAQPVDAFSAVASVSWSFGDGSASASGVQVSHTFNVPGVHTVTVTATDAVGNTSSKRLSVTVTSPSMCVVPSLKGKTLAQAKTLLSASHCALGKVTKPKARRHHRLGKLVVARSSPRAGAVEPAGTKVALTLAAAPRKR
jgi:hypothetical protein